MKAIRISEHGGVDVLRPVDLPVPEPGPGDVRVRLEAAALNHLDLWVRRGIPGVPYPLPLIPGCDGSGVVDAVGDRVSGWSQGDPVVLAPGVSCGVCAACAHGDDAYCREYGILGEHRDGTCAEFIVVPHRNVIAKPPNLTYAEAASMPLVFLTAWHMIHARARLRPGETILIHAAGSGVSSAGIQVARSVGATVIATAGTDAKVQRARDLGVDHAINYRKQDFLDEVRRITGKRGVDVVFDHVGRDTWDKNIRSLARGGRLVFCGNSSGPKAETSLSHVFFKNLAILGSTMGSRGEVHDVLRLAGQGALKPVIHTVMPLENVAEAHGLLERREAFGKVVLAVGSGHGQR